MARIFRLRAVTGITALVAALLAVSCQGRLDPDALSNRTALNETATVVSGESQIANAEATATTIANDLDRAATQIAEERSGPVNLPTPTPSVTDASRGQSTATPPRRTPVPIPARVNPSGSGSRINPANPVVPVAPPGPGDPPGPSAPGDPLPPGDPPGPGNPTDPGDPLPPGDPPGQGNPTDPGDPIAPGDPSGPSAPGDPSGPADPSPTPMPPATPTPAPPEPTPTPVSAGFGFTFDPSTAPTPVPPPSVYGPYSGSLAHLVNGDEAEQFPTGVETQDFLATATFVNPFPAAQRNWSIGLWLRVERSPAIYRNRGITFPGGERSEGLMVVLESNGDWSLIHRDVVAAPHGANIDDTPIQSGNVSGMNTFLDEENTIAVATYGNRGSLLVNGVLAAELDLSMHVRSGDVIALAGVLKEDEFAGSVTHVHSIVIAEADGSGEIAGDDGLGQIMAEAPVLAFSDVTGDFVVETEIPVLTPTFAGAWSWQIALEGQKSLTRLIVTSVKRQEIVQDRLLEDGTVETEVISASALPSITSQVGGVNSASIVVVDGRAGFLINGSVISGVELDPDDAYDITVSSFVNDETATTGPIVSVDSIRLWQPAVTPVEGDPAIGSPAAAGNPGSPGEPGSS